ncbi:MAG: hypothetical protein ACR2NU_03345, partial [Aeoliella sp.]
VVAHALVGCCAHEAHQTAATHQTDCCGHHHAPPADTPQKNDDHDCSHATCVWLATDDAPEIDLLLSSLVTFAEEAYASSVGPCSSANDFCRISDDDSSALPLRLYLAHCVFLI